MLEEGIGFELCSFNPVRERERELVSEREREREIEGKKPVIKLRSNFSPLELIVTVNKIFIY